MTAVPPTPIIPQDLNAREQWLIQAIRTRVRFGRVTITVQDGRVTHIEQVITTEKPEG